MKENIIILVALIVLVVLAGAQAIQLNGLKEKVSNKVVGTASASSDSSSSVSVPKSLENLPGMVGGC